MNKSPAAENNIHGFNFNDFYITGAVDNHKGPSYSGRGYAFTIHYCPKPKSTEFTGFKGFIDKIIKALTDFFKPEPGYYGDQMYYILDCEGIRIMNFKGESHKKICPIVEGISDPDVTEKVLALACQNLSTHGKHKIKYVVSTKWESGIELQ